MIDRTFYEYNAVFLCSDKTYVVGQSCHGISYMFGMQKHYCYKCLRVNMYIHKFSMRDKQRMWIINQSLQM